MLQKLPLLKFDLAKNAEKFLFLLWIIGAASFVYLTPPFFAPDETLHATWSLRFRTNQDPHTNGQCSLDERRILSFPFEKFYRTGNPVEVPRFIEGDEFPAAIDDCKIIHSSSTYVFRYLYLPLDIAMTLTGNIFSAQFLARIFQMLTMGFLIWLIVFKSSSLPTSRFILWPVMGFFVLPMSLQQSLSITTDFWVYSATLCLVFLITAKNLTKGQILIACSFMTLGGISKPVILPLFAFPFFWGGIFSENFKFKRFLRVIILLSLGIVFLRGFYFMYLVFNHAVPDRNGHLPGQTQFLIEFPLQSFFKIMKSSLIKPLQYPGTRLGWLSFEQPTQNYILAHIFIFIFLIKIAFQIFQKSKQNFSQINFSSSQKVSFILFAGLFLNIFMVGLSLFLGHSGPNSEFVDGLQSRYFFPTLICGVLFLVFKEGSKFTNPTVFPISKNQTLLVLGSLGLNLFFFFQKLGEYYPWVN